MRPDAPRRLGTLVAVGVLAKTHWFTEMLVTISSIGYGPVCTTLPVIRQLRPLIRDLDIPLIGMGSGLAKEQAKECGQFDLVIDCDVHSQPSLAGHEVLFRSAPCVLSNSATEPIRLAQRLGRPTMFIDILMFVHQHIPEELRRCALYLVQDFVGVQQQLSRLGMSAAMRLVGPLNDPARRTAVQGPPLIGLGGGSYAHHQSEQERLNTYSIVRALVLACRAAWRSQEVILVRGGSGAVDALRGLACDGLDIRCVPQTEYLDALGSAATVALVPGLTAMYECRQADRTPVLLPGLNHSQVIQAQRAANHWRWPAIHWADVGIPLVVDERLEEPEGNARLHAALRGVAPQALCAALAPLLATPPVHQPLPIPELGSPAAAAAVADALRRYCGGGGAERWRAAVAEAR